MQKRSIYTDKDLELIRVLRKEGTLSLYIFLCSVKRTRKKCNILTHSEKKALHNAIKYSKVSIRSNFKRLCDAGWATKTKGGYYLKSYGKIAKENGVFSQYNRFRKVEGKTNKELLARVGAIYIGNNLKAQQRKILGQAHCRNNKVSDVILCYDENVCFTVRKLAKLMGYTTPMSGTNLFREMEYHKLLRRKQVNSEVCTLSEFGSGVMRENWDRLFIDYSTLTVMKREASLIKMVK